MSVYSFLYVSRSLVHGDVADLEVADIVTVARQRNAELGVCGALLFTGAKFAQVLEGPRAAVEQLMDSINRDARHTDIITIRQGDAARRRFASWALAYSGPSVFVARAVDGAMDDSAAPSSAEQGKALLRLLEEFSKQ